MWGCLGNLVMPQDKPRGSRILGFWLSPLFQLQQPNSSKKSNPKWLGLRQINLVFNERLDVEMIQLLKNMDHFQTWSRNQPKTAKLFFWFHCSGVSSGHCRSSDWEHSSDQSGHHCLPRTENQRDGQMLSRTIDLGTNWGLSGAYMIKFNAESKVF